MANTNEIKMLLEKVDIIDRITDKDWKQTLNNRKIKELEFHDRDRDQNIIEQISSSDTFEKFYGNKKYYTVAKRSNQFVKEWIRKETIDKIFLDYACGNGSYAIFAASVGAALSLGFDISSISVQNAKVAAVAAGVSGKTRFFQADAENIKLPDNSIDIILCSGMLHHLDLSYAIPEIRRILKPGGKILAYEALDYNLAIKLYRKLTPDMRTDWEKAHILNLNDVKFATRFLELIDIRYWHVLGYLGGKFPILLPFLNNVDRILEKVPLIQRLSWMFTFVLRKKSEE